MTLFHRAAPDEPLFSQVLDRFYGGIADPMTDALLPWGACSPARSARPGHHRRGRLGRPRMKRTTRTRRSTRG